MMCTHAQSYCRIMPGMAMMRNCDSQVCAFFWKVTVDIEGTAYSWVLLLCAVLSGGIGCMSNVTYWAFASRYPVYCTKAMSTGMTFGGLLASAIIVGQNAGSDPVFSGQIYFLIAVGIQLLMLVGTLPILRFQEHHHHHTTPPSTKKALSSVHRSDSKHRDAEGTSEHDPLLASTSARRTVNYDVPRKSKSRVQPSYIDHNGLVLCMICFVIYGMTYALYVWTT